MSKRTPGPLGPQAKDTALYFATAANHFDALLEAVKMSKTWLESIYRWDAGQRFCGQCNKSVATAHKEDCPIAVIDNLLASIKAAIED